MFNEFNFTDAPIPLNEYLEEVESQMKARELEKEASSLRGSRWVSNHTIDNYLELIRERSMENKDLPTVCSVSTGFHQIFLINGFDKTCAKKYKDLFDTDLVFSKLQIKCYFFGKQNLLSFAIVFGEKIHC